MNKGKNIIQISIQFSPFQKQWQKDLLNRQNSLVLIVICMHINNQYSLVLIVICMHINNLYFNKLTSGHKIIFGEPESKIREKITKLYLKVIMQLNHGKSI